MKLPLLAIVSSLAMLTAPTQAATYTFNATSGIPNWGTNTTWTPNGTPGSADDVVIVSAGSTTLGITQNRSASTLNATSLTGGFNIIGNIAGNNTLAIGALNKSGANSLTLRNSGTNQANALSVNITTVNLSGTGDLNFGSSNSTNIAAAEVGTLTLSSNASNGLFYFGADNQSFSISSANITSGLIVLRNIATGNTTLSINSLTGSGGTIKAANTNSGNGSTGILILANSSGTASYAGTLVDGQTASKLHVQKTNAGTQVLSGNNTYTGTTTISGGTLQANHTSALGVGGNITFGGGVLQYTSASAAQDWSTRFKSSSGAIALDSNGQNITLSGAIDASNTGGLTKSGAGTLTLNGSSSYTGVTTISAGTLQIGAGGTTGSIVSSSSIVNNAELLINRSNDIALANSLSGSGNLTKSGLGTLTVSGSNTGSGAVSVTGGTLLLSGATAVSSSSSLLSAASGTTISLADGVGRTITLSSGNLSLSSATMVFELGSTSDRITLTSGLATLSGTNTIRLADIGSFSAGTYTLISATSGLNGNWSLDSTNGPAGFNYTLSNSSTSLSLIASTNSNLFYWTGNASANWSGNNFSATDGGASSLSASNFSATSDLVFASSGATNLTTTMGGNYTVNSLSISTPSISIGGSDTLTLNSTDSAAISVSAASGNTTISANLAGSSAGLTKSGAGKLILSGNNTFAGATAINVGELNVQHANALGATAGGTTVAASAALQLEGGITIGAEALSISGTGVSNDGALRNISGNNTYSGAITLAAATRINSDSGLLTLSGGIGGTQALSIGGSGNTTISGVIATASGSLTKDGSGTLTLTASNTYTGATTITAGTLQIGAGGTSGALSASSTLTNNGTLVFNRSNAMAQGTDFANVIAGSGNVIKSGVGNLTLSGNNTFTGQLTIAEGAVIVTTVNNSGTVGVLGNSTSSVVLGSNGKNGTLSFGGSSNVSSNKAFTMSSGGTGIIEITSNQLTIGPIDGTGALSKTGAGTLVLSSTNTYSGGSSLLVGTVAIGNDAAFGSGAVNFAGAQLRATSGASRTIANSILISADTTFSTLASEKSLTFTGNTTLSGGTRVLNVQLGSTVNTEKLTLSGAIDDGGNGFGITKTGNGTLALSGSNTYTGATLVSAGTLEIGNLNALQNTTLDTGTSGAQIVNFTVSGASIYNLGGLQGSDALSMGNNTLSIGANNASTTFSGVISGAGGNLSKVGSGTLTLNGANTYTGATLVSAGTLEIGNLNALQNTTLDTGTSGAQTVTFTVSGAGIYNLGGLQGSDALSMGNNTLSIGANNASTTFSGVISGADGNLSKVGSGTLTLNGANTYTGATTISAGTLQIGANGTTGVLSISSALNNNGTLVFNRSNTITQGTDFANVIAGSGNVIKAGSGTLILSGANTYTGATTISAGTLQIGANGTTGALSISSALNNNGTLVFNRNNTITQGTDFANVIAGSGNVIKAGSGTLILSGANTYTGTTNIESGTVAATASNALGSTSQIIVNNGGSLLVTADDAVNSNANVTLAGGTLAVSGTFNESVGLLTLSADSIIDLNGYNGTLRFSGLGAWAEGARLAIWNWNGINQYGTPVGSGDNTRHVVFTDASSPTDLTNYLGRISFYSDSGNSFAGNGFEVGFSGGGTEIIAVPEPGAYLCGIALLVGLLVQRMLKLRSKIS